MNNVLTYVTLHKASPSSVGTISELSESMDLPFFYEVTAHRSADFDSGVTGSS